MGYKYSQNPRNKTEIIPYGRFPVRYALCVYAVSYRDTLVVDMVGRLDSVPLWRRRLSVHGPEWGLFAATSGGSVAIQARYRLEGSVWQFY